MCFCYKNYVHSVRFACVYDIVYAAGDSLTSHDGMSFSTKDRDNDSYDIMNCAQRVRGAWWYYKCFSVSLNNQYLHGYYTSFYNGIAWAAWHGTKYSLKKVDMKLRPYQP